LTFASNISASTGANVKSAPLGRLPATSPVSSLKPQTRCREISEADLGHVADLLASGFYGRPRDYWLQGLRRQASRQVPQGYPRFGYMLDHEGLPVGVLLLIYSLREANGEAAIHCNL